MPNEIHPMKRNPLAIIIGALLHVVIGLLLFMFQVRTTEVAVDTFFGNIASDGGGNLIGKIIGC